MLWLISCEQTSPSWHILNHILTSPGADFLICCRGYVKDDTTPCTACPRSDHYQSATGEDHFRYSATQRSNDLTRKMPSGKVMRGVQIPPFEPPVSMIVQSYTLPSSPSSSGSSSSSSESSFQPAKSSVEDDDDDDALRLKERCEYRNKIILIQVAKFSSHSCLGNFLTTACSGSFYVAHMWW